MITELVNSFKCYPKYQEVTIAKELKEEDELGI